MFRKLSRVTDYSSFSTEFDKVVKEWVGVVRYVLYKSDRVNWKGFVRDDNESVFHTCLMANGFSCGLIETDATEVKTKGTFTRRIFVFNQSGLKASVFVLVDKAGTVVPDVEGDSEVQGTLSVETINLKFRDSFIVPEDLEKGVYTYPTGFIIPLNYDIVK